MIQCPYCGEYTDIGAVFVDYCCTGSGENICKNCSKRFKFSYFVYGHAFTMETPDKEYDEFKDAIYKIDDFAEGL